ncbi:glycosyltransferase family 4 protein [Gemmata sp. JC673]|uniref:Glycosyltransferase family 4 protein n=1 Tax=Gemmata algarum TaxID=2975278 RepID=A0ABU5ER78_9BACT|nr:glycosyltransferase family 4 protein [Gemmata algarum]MDY3557838.1 glycosyltransferase family 4 protein [Gemmata algarum]
MRITILSGPFQPFPPAPGGAVERVWHGLAEAFAAQGHTVTVLCKAGVGQKVEETVNGVRYVRRTGFTAGPRLLPNLVKDLGYSLQMQRLLPPADVLVTHSFWAPVVAHLRRGVGRVVVHVARMPKGQLRLYDRAARLNVPSSAVRDAIAGERPQLLAKVRVVPYPVDGRFTPPAEKRPRKPQPTVLFAGRIHPEKGLDLLVEAFARLDPVRFPARLRIVGPWLVAQGGAGGEYRAALAAKSAGRAVELVEPVFDRVGLANEYRAADLFCYPSLAEAGETFGVAPLEAMATGLPPVVSDLACFRDFITDGATGVVFDHRRPDPAGRLAEQLGRLLGAPALREQIAGRAASRAAAHTLPRVAAAHLRDFEEVLSE